MNALNSVVPSQGGVMIGAKQMPYEKKVNGKKLCVYKVGADSPLHCYPNTAQGEKDANRYLAALYMHSKDASGNVKTEGDAYDVAIEVCDTLQMQMNRERANAVLYDALASAFEFMNFTGFAKFMARNADEERGHAKLFFDYLSDIGEQPRIDALPAVNIALTGDEYIDTLSMFEQALEAEKANKQALYLVNDVAEDEDDGTEAFMIPILVDQIKSIKEFEEHVTWLQVGRGNAALLLAYDEKLGKD